MSDLKATLWWCFLVLVIVVVLGFGANALGLISLKIFGIQYENTRNQIFQQSQAHTNGMQHDLDRYHLQYLQAKDPAEKAAILDLVRHQFSAYNGPLTSDQQYFLNQVKNGGTP